MKPYIPRQPKQTRERLEAKLERSLLQTLERYCEYLDSDRDYVLSGMLQVVFRKDKGFAEWLEARSSVEPVSGPAAHSSADPEI